MKILSYRGVSLLSKGIRAFTWGEYSHIAWPLFSGNIIEAWKGGIRITQHPFTGHSRRTRVWLHDVIDFDESKRPAVEGFLLSQVGKGYDYSGILRFMRRRDPRRWRDMTAKDVDPADVNRWICSSIGAYALARYERPLQDLPWWRMSPRLVVASPRVGLGTEIFPNTPWPDIEAWPLVDAECTDPYLWEPVPL